MSREEIRNKIINYFKQQLSVMKIDENRIQMSFIVNIFQEDLKNIATYKQEEVFHISREIINELININALYPGAYGQNTGNDFYPWLTITEYGKELFSKDDSLPYDPEGYLKVLKEKIPEIDDITLIYIGEAIAAFNRRNLLSATITLGVASENLMLILIDIYINWLKDAKRKNRLTKNITDKYIYTRYKEFKKEFILDVKILPKKLQDNWETYLDGVFNFIRLNRNSAGHPTGKQLNTKIVYANLQIFADYARYIFNLVNYFH